MRNPHLVRGPVAVSLAGGRPAAPGDVVDIDPAADAALVESGALVPTGTGERPARAARKQDDPKQTTAEGGDA